MHLLAAIPGAVADGSEPVDLGQTPGEIVLLSAADTELACFAAAQDGRLAQDPDAPSLRLANLLFLGHNYSVDRYCDTVIQHAGLVIARLLGGAAYWSYGAEQLADICRKRGIPLALLPGDDKPDPELQRLSTVDTHTWNRLWRYCVQGGVANATNGLAYAASLLGRQADWREPRPLVPAGLYWPGIPSPGPGDLAAHWREGAATAAIIFYRAHVLGANLAPIDGLIAALRREGINPVPIYLASLKDRVSVSILRELFAATPPDVILNTTGFAVASPSGDQGDNPLRDPDCTVLQLVLAGGGEADWRDGAAGLSARDIAMNVALPEVDGRVLSRAISFKGEIGRHDPTQCAIAGYVPVPDRVAFVASLAARWAALRREPPASRRVAIVLANYPNRDGRLGNGVGLDTPAGVAEAIAALEVAGHDVAGAPVTGAALMDDLRAGVTNDWTDLDHRVVTEGLSLDDYRAAFEALPEPVRAAITERWGAPETDPFVRNGSFRLATRRYGNLAIGVQPARGYNIDPIRDYHSPDLVPPHNYFAFYVWLRREFGAHAIVHFGKHGNLEWLPGKALALSEACFPEAMLGPLPHLYPFIVNDPGEGSQAKRRAAAVVVDHLTPPLTRAESYGPLRRLELLVDEYYEAAGMDRRRLAVLRDDILELSASIGLDADLGIAREDSADDALAKLDNHLCELKELQIRDGLHVFGQSPTGRQETDLLVALLRLPRAGARAAGSADAPRADASLIRALASDLKLPEHFDPLDCDFAAAWDGPRPDALAGLTGDSWRSAGDTVERLELLAASLVHGDRRVNPNWSRTAAVLIFLEETLRPVVAGCGAAECQGLVTGLSGRFVPPGPSGAPTRGRPEVLPTGRNFFSVDTRAVPTPTAWRLGWKSAGLIIDRYLQEHGDWPRRVALSAWGTANMRTGGDDVAQALALMGAQPTWDTASGRVTGFEIMPVSVLGRPRVDVTLRISGFFRDAFPGLIDLVDSAARAVADLDESADDNPLAARVASDSARFAAAGMPADAARARAGFRVFGAKPGAYGAGLQALIDEGGWDSANDLADAWLAWGGYAYGASGAGATGGGIADRALLEDRLRDVQAVLHNQDNREHDILDSDDYYQFEGGLAATVRALSGAAPAIYHNDHSRPESPKVRGLDEEIARIVRGRAVNPKWIAGCRRHGYKGAAEMAATVDYLFAFAATTGCVRDHHFDAVYDAYLADETVRDFLENANPAARREIAQRLLEALNRGLWRPRRNTVHADLAAYAEAA